jgi:hypothetical protein
MAKHEKVLPARRPRTRKGDESVLLQSADAIGRVIGSLQRQLDSARGRLSNLAADGFGAHSNGNGNGNGSAPPRKASKQTAATERSTTSKSARPRKPAAMKAKRTATASRGKKKASHTR